MNSFKLYYCYWWCYYGEDCG